MNEKGTIRINHSWNELKVNLSKMYKWSVRYTDYHKLESNLTYVIDNDDKNVTFKLLIIKNRKMITMELISKIILRLMIL